MPNGRRVIARHPAKRQEDVLTREVMDPAGRREDLRSQFHLRDLFPLVAAEARPEDGVVFAELRNTEARESVSACTSSHVCACIPKTDMALTGHCSPETGNEMPPRMHIFRQQPKERTSEVKLMRLPSGCTAGCAVVSAPLTSSLKRMGPRVASVSMSSTNVPPSANSVMLTAEVPSGVGITLTCSTRETGDAPRFLFHSRTSQLKVSLFKSYSLLRPRVAAFALLKQRPASYNDRLSSCNRLSDTGPSSTCLLTATAQECLLR